MVQPIRNNTRRAATSSSSSSSSSSVPSVSIFLAGLGVGVVCSTLVSGPSRFFLYPTNNNNNFGPTNKLSSAQQAIIPCEDGNSSNNKNNNNDKEPPTSSSSSIQVVGMCNNNPYRSSLLDGHTFETAEQKARIWMANRTNIRDALYWRSYGKHTHDKFDVFETMAPCNYKCTGQCKADTSKIVCGVEALQPGCIVYSIGGNNDWEFEQRIYDMTPCFIHTFDCTGPRGRFRPPINIQDRHQFHHVCLATQNVKPVADPTKVKHSPPDWGVVGAMETLQSIQKRLRHDRLDLLKLDIEGFEWPIFESWPELRTSTNDDDDDDQQLGEATASNHHHHHHHRVVPLLPMQILVEIHYRTAMHELWPQKGVIFKNEIDLVNLQAHLINMGYVVAIRDDNEMCKHCTELTLLRHKCVQQSSSSK